MYQIEFYVFLMGEELDNSWFIDREKEIEIERLLQEVLPSSIAVHTISRNNPVTTNPVSVIEGVLELEDYLDNGDRLFICTTPYTQQDFINNVGPPPPEIVLEKNPVTLGKSILGFSALNCAFIIKQTKTSLSSTRRRRPLNQRRTRKMKQRL